MDKKTVAAEVESASDLAAADAMRNWDATANVVIEQFSQVLPMVLSKS